MKRILLVALLAALPSVVFAQGAPNSGPPSAYDQALSEQVMTELNAKLQCKTSVFDLQAALAKANGEVARLTEKYEPKPKTEAAPHPADKVKP